MRKREYVRCGGRYAIQFSNTGPVHGDISPVRISGSCSQRPSKRWFSLPSELSRQVVQYFRFGTYQHSRLRSSSQFSKRTCIQFINRFMFMIAGRESSMVPTSSKLISTVSFACNSVHGRTHHDDNSGVGAYFLAEFAGLIINYFTSFPSDGSVIPTLPVDWWCINTKALCWISTVSSAYRRERCIS